MTKSSHMAKSSVSVKEDYTGMKNRVYIAVLKGRNIAHLYRSMTAKSVKRNNNLINNTASVVIGKHCQGIPILWVKCCWEMR